MQEMKPMEIERKSFEIIASELTVPLAAGTEDIVKRVIHATADFDYAENLVFSENAVKCARDAISGGCDIVTDTEMAKSGINKKILASFGGNVHCFVGNETVAREAERRGVTRSKVAMEYAAGLEKPCIFVIGNAPTALMSLLDLAEAGKVSPALVVGAPVGFVHVVESKERLLASGLPYIVARGRKGGSNVAAAIVNALVYAIRR